MVKISVALMSSMVAVLSATAALAQAIAPLAVDGPAQAALRQLRPPSALEQVREQSMRRTPPLPLPPPATAERWVAERRVFAPALGREIVIPGHHEQRVSDQQYAVPLLSGRDVGSGLPVTVPGDLLPPVGLRQGP